MASPPYIPGTQPPEILLARQNVAPPSALYISREEKLLVQVVAFENDPQVIIHARVLLPSGEIIPNQFRMPTVITNTVNSYEITLPEGFLLSLVVYSGSTLFEAGDTFVRVFTYRGSTSAPIIGTILAQGYLTTIDTLSWPAGDMRPPLDRQVNSRRHTDSTPVLGGEVLVTVPNNSNMILQTVVATLTTSFTAATRVVTLTIDDGSTVLYRVYSTLGQPLNTAVLYVWAVGATNITVTDTYCLMPLPHGIVMASGWRVRTVTTLLKADDQWSKPELCVLNHARVDSSWIGSIAL